MSPETKINLIKNICLFFANPKEVITLAFIKVVNVFMATVQKLIS